MKGKEGIPIGISWLQYLMQTASIIVAILVSLSTLRQREQGRAAQLAAMQADIKHIKARVDAVDALRERLPEVENSVKSAHKRMDEHIQYEHAERRRGA